MPRPGRSVVTGWRLGQLAWALYERAHPLGVVGRPQLNWRCTETHYRRPLIVELSLASWQRTGQHRRVLATNTSSETPTTFASQLVAGIVVAANNNQPFVEAEWRHLVDNIKRCGEGGKQVNILVHASGSGPNRAQRTDLNTLTETMPIRIAVVTDSKVSRAAIKGVSWLAKVDVRGFSPEDSAAAYSYLEVPDDAVPEIEEALVVLKKTLGLL